MPYPWSGGQTLTASDLNSAISTASTTAAAGSLTGTTLASNVVNSSLTSVGTLVSGSIPATLLTGIIASARLSGSYSSITGLGTLTSLSITGTITTPTQIIVNGSNADSPQIEIGDWNQDGRYSALRSAYGYLLLGSAANVNCYLRTNNASGNVIIGGGLDVSLMTVSGTGVSVSGTVTSTGRVWAQSDLRIGNAGQVLSSNYFRLVVTPQNYTSLTVELGEFYSSSGVGTTNPNLSVWAASSVSFVGASTGTTWAYFTNTELYMNSRSISGVGNGLPYANNAYYWGLGVFGVNAWSYVGSYNFFNPSDERYKANRVALSLGLSFLRRLTPIEFTYVYPQFDADTGQVVSLENGTRLRAGLSAQDVKRALVDEGAGDFNLWSLVDPSDPQSVQVLDYTGLIAPLIQAVKELDNRVTSLERT